MKKSNKKQKKKKNSNGAFKHRYRYTDYEESFSQWDSDVEKALNGKMSEDERSEVATKEALLKSLRTFTEKLTQNLDRFNTNLGLILETRTSVAGSLVVYGTGENGSNEFVPVVITVNLGVPQDVKTHGDFLVSGKWHSMTLPPKEESEISIFRPQLVKGPRSSSIR